MLDFLFSAPNPAVFTCEHDVHSTPSCTLKTIFPLTKPLDLVFDGNCKQALNILQVLSGTSWDRGKIVILKLYCALIHTKSEYGSFVYSSASKSELSILDAVHNAGIPLATGAFCTSHFPNTYMELWEWPLLLWRDLLLSSYTTKLAVHPRHPSYIALFCPSFHCRYEINIRVSRPVHVWFQHHLDSLHAHLSYELFPADVLPFHSGLSVNLFMMCFLLNTEVMKYQSFFAVITLHG